jgi:twitching motility protein PilT
MATLNYFSEARKRKSQELLLVLGSEAKCRVQKNWVSLDSSPVLLSEWNQVLKALLKSDQLQRLESEGTLEGCAQMSDGFRASYSIFQSHDCFKAHFFFEPTNVFETELSLPAVFLETVSRRQGLILLAGPVHPYKTNTLAQTLFRLNKDHAFHGAIFSKQAFPGIPEEKASFVYQSTSVNDAGENGLFAGADVVVLHETVSAKSLAHAMDLCDEGKMVMMTIASNSLMSAFHKCLELLSEKPNPHSLWRFAEHLKMAISQHPLTSLNDETLLGFEMLLNTPQIKSWVAHGQLSSLETLLHSQSENSGVLNLNQSLLQLLIRRRIDMKQAFLATHDPDGLDQLLKKVGI